MLKKITSDSIYFADYGWHTGRFHFSFADYDDPDNSHFGVLRALNEFVLQPGSGFDTHPHAEMEIISYCVEGELTHGDSMGHTNTLQSGDVQYLSAGSGITHREINEPQDRSMRFFQIWITPQDSNLTPKYECKHFSRLSSQHINIRAELSKQRLSIPLSEYRKIEVEHQTTSLPHGLGNSQRVTLASGWMNEYVGIVHQIHYSLMWDVVVGLWVFQVRCEDCRHVKFLRLHLELGSVNCFVTRG